MPAEEIQTFVENSETKGLKIKWFGSPKAIGFTSTDRHWNYLESEDLESADLHLAQLCDVRLPSTLSKEDCQIIADIILEVIEK